MNGAESSQRRGFEAIRVFVAPKATYRELSEDEGPSSIWLAMRRPLFIAFAFACAIVFMATAQLSVGSVLSAMLYWSYVPATELLALVLTCGRRVTRLPRARLIDIFFVSHTAWLIWIAGWALITNLAPQSVTFTLFFPYIVGGAIVALVWSLWVDWHFFRIVCGKSAARASTLLAMQRLLSWPIVVAVFGYGSLSTVAEFFRP